MPPIYRRPGPRYTAGVFIAIAGMHRSGTSMVARMLALCGMSLGDPQDMLPAAPDNPEGFWEHHAFVALNGDVLDVLGGAWDLPPVPPADWAAAPEMLPLRTRAAALLGRFASVPAFGWKDPRNSLTLGFWRSLVPDLRVVVCLRNPLAVARSLQVRAKCSEVFGVALWWAYHERIVAAVPPGQRVVTHYESYFHDPLAELRRICTVLGLSPSRDQLASAVATVRADLRHHHRSTVQVLEHVRPAEAADLYMRLCSEAGPVYQAALAAEPVGPGPEATELPDVAAAWMGGLLRARVVHLEAEAKAQAAEIETLRAQLAGATAALEDLHVAVAGAGLGASAASAAPGAR